ncbi:MAG: tRNA epoxyqueuosine(34) reductase QueG [Patescibacteria group bacterium]
MISFDRIEERAEGFGFDIVGVTPLKRSSQAAAFSRWLRAGQSAEMDWLKRNSSERIDPRKRFPDYRTVVSLAVNYYQADWPADIKNDPSRGLIARYAWSKDYHQVILDNLKKFIDWLMEQTSDKVLARPYVDTGPLLERSMANEAGLGWTGRNANLINNKLGSYLFLAEILVDQEIGNNQNKVIGSCGQCRRCIDTCPTKALVEERVLDANKCLAYQTIEQKGSIPAEIRPLMKNRIFGCDICQEICPWNKKAKPTIFGQENVDWQQAAPPLLSIVNLTATEFRRRFAGTPVLRARRAGFQRNVIVALGNWGDKRGVPAIEKAIKEDPSEMVREHARWARGQIINT